MSGNNHIEDTPEKIRMIGVQDAYYCYSGQGHGVDIEDPAGLGLLIYGFLFATNESKITYETVDAYYIMGGAQIKSLMANLEAALKNGANVFFIEYCLREYDTELHNQYVTLLYRFASLVSKADGTVTKEETEWLEHISSLRLENAEDTGAGERGACPISFPLPASRT